MSLPNQHMKVIALLILAFINQLGGKRMFFYKNEAFIKLGKVYDECEIKIAKKKKQKMESGVRSFTELAFNR
ncbi:hypothetical protein [Parageobacillus thermantarcticus]|nr:hypothetical protein [Parageobacillus thermantarcticus]